MYGFHKHYVSNTFSPMMLKPGCKARIREISEDRFAFSVKKANRGGFESIIGHQLAAEILSEKTGRVLAFNRTNEKIEGPAYILVGTPEFRPEVSREFTHKEIENAPYRYFLVEVSGVRSR